MPSHFSDCELEIGLGVEIGGKGGESGVHVMAAVWDQPQATLAILMRLREATREGSMRERPSLWPRRPNEPSPHV